MNRTKWPLVWAILFGAAFALSLVAWLVQPRPLREAVLYFPAAAGESLRTELRHLPAAAEPERRVTHLVEAALGGPTSLEFRRIVPSGSRLLSVFVAGKKCYIDLSGLVQAPSADCPLEPDRRVELIRKAVAANERGFEQIVLLVEGKEVVQ